MSRDRLEEKRVRGGEIPSSEKRRRGVMEDRKRVEQNMRVEVESKENRTDKM